MNYLMNMRRFSAGSLLRGINSNGRIRDKHPNTGLVIKSIPCGMDNMLLVLRISTAADREGYKNSLITSWKISEKRLNNYMRNKEVIYKKV